MKTVEEILNAKGRQVWTISPQATVIDALKLMADRNVGCLVVLENDRIVGIISERDYARKIALRGKSSVNTPVKDIMSTTVYHIHLQNTVDDCLQLMTQQTIRHLPVEESGKLLGLISIGDVVKAVIDEQSTTITQLSDYISGKYIGT
ncbi:MAG TPA: CBS domain-containing protein [Anaerolineales bacterium]|nr:CBS domain-containing protein [Anaerolineales bacterium]